MIKAGYLNMLIGTCFLSGFIIINPAHAQKKPNFDEVMADFIEKIEANSLYIGDNYTHQERTTTRTLKNGVVTEIKEEHYLVEKMRGELYKKLVEKDGLAVTNPGFKKKDEIISIGIELLERYKFAFARNETLAGARCWVFSFRPKKNLPELSTKDAALNLIAGEIWVSQNDLSFKKISGRLLSEANISKFIGSAKLYKLDFVATAGLIDGRFAIDYIWVEYIYEVKLFGFVTIINNRHEVKEIFYEDYKRRTK